MESGGSAADLESEAASQHSSPEEERKPTKDTGSKKSASRTVADSEEGLANLLKQAEKYTNHLLYGETDSAAQRNYQKKRRLQSRRGEDMQEEAPRAAKLNCQPEMLQNGSLRDYQIDGVSWMFSLYHTGINGILADEMGLGKTIQTIAFLAHLREAENVMGPHLIVVPKSTMGNWEHEFAKWCPTIRLVKLIASKPHREEILRTQLLPGKFDVCVTSYEGVSICHNNLKKYQWVYLMIDEAHKIKNDESNLSQLVRKLRSAHRLLITGTPLQNNLHELWSLLNFLLPDLFASSEDFDEWFKLGAEEGLSTSEIEAKNVKMVQRLHKILKPFLLRRTKAEVERGLPPKKEILVSTKMCQIQRELYKKILTNELIRQDSKAHYLNIVMQLRKVCNHPFLFAGIEDESGAGGEEQIIVTSGKMRLLDRLLPRLKEGGSQVLIFSQMTSMLDILEDYCVYRKYKYCRLDGSTDIIDRDKMIRKFTQPNSKYFIFLLSTRAGGLGINLASADTVIIYDSDWNPQMDLQAMDRAHRIGQTRQVNVYRLITTDTLEERIIERQCLRLKLDSLIIQQGRLAPKHKTLDKDDLQEMLHYGADAIFKASDEDQDITQADLELILQRGVYKFEKLNQDLEEELERKKMNLVDFESKIDLWQFESVDYSKKRRDEARQAIQKAIDEKYLEEYKARRDRKLQQNYNIDARFGTLMPPQRSKEFKPAPDFRFYSSRDRLVELQKKEYNKETMTDEEKAELDTLLDTGLDWSRKEYLAYLRGCELYGKEAYKLIADVIATKSEDEVKEYAQVFWSRLDELTDKEKILKNIEKRESTAERHRHSQVLLDSKFELYRNPWRELQIDSSCSHKSKLFTNENDRFLICMTKTVGYGNWDQLKLRVRKSGHLRFDYLLRSRTTGELQRRVDSLLRLLEKEEEEKRKGEDMTLPVKRPARDDVQPSPEKKPKAEPIDLD